MNAHASHPNYEADNCPRCGTAQARMGQMDPSAIVGTQPILSAMPIKVWASGANMVGYLPEGDVDHSLDYSDAKAFLIDRLDRYGDHEQSWVDEHACDDIPCPTYGDSCGWNLAQEASAAMEELNLCSATDENGGEFHAYIGNLHFWLVVNTPEYFGLDEEGLAELGWEPPVPSFSDLLESPPAGCSAVADLFHWSTNYDAGKGPATLFIDMLGISQEEYGSHQYDLSEPSLGYVELEKLSAALAEYVSCPESVRTFVSALLNAEDK